MAENTTAPDRGIRSSIPRRALLALPGALALALAGCSNAAEPENPGSEPADVETATSTVELTADFKRTAPAVDGTALSQYSAEAAAFAVRLLQAELGLEPAPVEKAKDEAEASEATAETDTDPATSSVDPDAPTTSSIDPDAPATSSVDPEAPATSSVDPEAPATSAADPEVPATSSTDPDAPAARNLLVSPLSLLRALGLVVLGAEGDTLAQIEDALGMERDALVTYLVAYARTLNIDPQTLAAQDNTWIDSPLAESTPAGSAAEKEAADAAEDEDKAPETTLEVAESLWIKDEPALSVEDDYLQACVDDFDAQVFSGPFDAQTCADLNTWVSDKTAGRIPKLLDELPADAVLYLVNALAFTGTWTEPYDDADVEDHAFTCEDGTEQPMTLMRSTENSYLALGGARGFVKPYAGKRFAFCALLPSEGTALSSLVAQLTGEKLADAVANAEATKVEAGMPRFTARCRSELTEALGKLGVADLFAPALADLAGIGTMDDGAGLAVSQVLQETFVNVDEQGTEAAAATALGISAASAAPEEEPKQVILDRPFVYFIWDTQTAAPVFAGTLASMKGLEE